MEVTDDKSLPKAERKRLQIVHASQISVRAQVVKLADKISNLRGIIASPPADGVPGDFRLIYGMASTTAPRRLEALSGFGGAFPEPFAFSLLALFDYRESQN